LQQVPKAKHGLEYNTTELVQFGVKITGIEAASELALFERPGCGVRTAKEPGTYQPFFKQPQVILTAKFSQHAK